MKNLINILLAMLMLSGCSQNGGNSVIENGDIVLLHFTMGHADGLKFDASDHSDHQWETVEQYPLRLVAGRGDVIIGFDRAILGMTEGEKKSVQIPPGEAFGEAGVPDIIMPNETISLEVEIIKIIKK